MGVILPAATAGDTTPTATARTSEEEEVAAAPIPTTTAHDHLHVSSREKVSRWQLFLQEASCHATMVIAGWSDASSGPLIPYIQAYYGISYTVVSMLFVGQMVGFLTAGFMNSYLTEKYGLGKVITLGAFVQALGYILLIPGFPFPIMPCCYAVIGFGMALQDAQANVYVATLDNAEHKFGILHASYGLGALVCPLAATAFASSGIRFSFFYSLSVGLAGLNIMILLWAFKFNYRVDEGGVLERITAAEEEEVVVDREGMEMGMMKNSDVGNGVGLGLGEGGILPIVATTTRRTWERRASFNNRNHPSNRKLRGKLWQTLHNRTMWICSVFILVYVGAEVSMGGWIVTFMVDSRQGGASAGYIATGFWAGITLGRALLPRLNVLVGEKRIVPFYIAAGICLELVIWFAKNLIADAVIVALIGVVMGPLYPITMSLATKILPRSLHSSAVGFIAAFGQTGSAIFPFLTGALAQKYSTFVLQPVMISLFVVMVGIWWWVPSPDLEKDD